jgi:riboflavin synthase
MVCAPKPVFARCYDRYCTETADLWTTRTITSATRMALSQRLISLNFAAWRGRGDAFRYGFMFTGIVEETGRVISFVQEKTAWRLKIAAGVALQNVALGDSIAINGCCLTVVSFDSAHFEFDVLEETRRLTAFSTLKSGSAVNLERSLRFDGKVGGHFVTGHIDGVGVVEVFEKRGADYYLRVRAPGGGGRLIVHKGSIAIDGISLTVAEVDGDSFAVWLIPHTVQITNLHAKRLDDLVNLEFDLLGKYVEKLLAHPQPKTT